MANFKTVAFNIVLIGFILNSVTFAFSESGVAEDWGIDPEPGGGQAIEDVRENADRINPANGLGNTLFASFSTAASVGNAILTFMFAVPGMINNLPGIPDWVDDLIGFPLTLIWFGAIIYLVAGRVL